ncbi:MAG: protease Do [Acidobacteria bacterium]|nr:protease Do [Acidobacteriota bacterium]
MDKQQSKSVPGSKRIFGVLMILCVLALGITIGTLISYRVDATGPADSQLQMQSDGKPLVGGAYLALSQGFEEVSKRIKPTVVNVNTEEVVQNRRQAIPPGQDPENPDDFFRRFFNGPLFQMPEQEMQRSLGSGVIVDPKGYIITNNHVVEGATKIKVSISDGEEYTAKVIGTDPISDIAVIKITGKKDFPYAKIGSSKGMKVGDWVIAIGSPFGLEQTVTAGIISTTGRMFKDGGGPSDYAVFNDYLQTDAAINRGNSGGPLVNMNGEVVGINSFISTASGSSAGVGFAVPSHLFVRVYNQILQTGKVARGWVGVSMNRLPFTPAMANFFGVKQGSGVLITQLVDENVESSETGPAAKAGIKPEDVVIEFDGKKIRDTQDFRLAVADTPPGKSAKVKIVRHGQEKELEITVAERKFENREKSQYSFEEKEKPKAEIGLSFDNVPPRIAKAMNVAGGAYVTSVSPGSLADDAGLTGSEQGGNEVIVAANGKPVNDKDDLLNIVKGLKTGDPIVLKFIRGDRTQDNQILTETCYTSIIKP